MNEFAGAAANQDLRERVHLALELREDLEAPKLEDPEAVGLDLEATGLLDLAGIGSSLEGNR